MAGAFSSNRAFIQWAGFTFGLASSFYDFYSGPAVSYYGGQIIPASDTGDGGNWVGAYTAQFGNGLSATISAEDDRANRATAIWNTIRDNMTFVGSATQRYASPNWPDIVGNLRLEQSWGAVQIMGAIHDVNSEYDGVNTAIGGASSAGDKTGYAIGAGIKLFAPMIGKGDYLQAQFNYTEGALGYVWAGRGNLLEASFRDGGTYGYGIINDAVVTGAPNSSALQLTTGWGINASYEHYWNDQWKTSVYGVYAETSFNGAANNAMCTRQAALFVGATTGVCDNDWSYFAVGSRTQWNVTKAFYMGVDVVYAHVNTASDGLTGFFAGANTGSQPAGTRSIQDQDALIGYFRVHYDFLP
jgi:hypothetical protein